ncbi:MAG: phosphatidate cytidylyltransferase [Alphaproteobacteria bacterium]
MPKLDAAFLRSENFRQRFISSLVMGPVTLVAVYFGGWIFTLFITLVMLLALREWLQLASHQKKRGLWIASGFLYTAVAGLSLLYLRQQPFGLELVLYVIAVVWGTDIGGYMAGRMIGGPKLAPKISPNKTWAGLLGGMILAALLGYGVLAAFGTQKVGGGIIIAMVMACVAQAGDLFESHLKRRSGIKESGNLIPGHGGVLDRIDGLVFASVFFVLFQAAYKAVMQW